MSSRMFLLTSLLNVATHFNCGTTFLQKTFCKLCDKTFRVEDDLNEHMEGNLATCVKELLTKKLCTVHIEKCHGTIFLEPKYCIFCDKTF